MRYLYFILACIVTCGLNGQNRNNAFGFSLGVGNSGFEMEEIGADKVESLYYPSVGISYQRKLDDRWAASFSLTTGMSGNKRFLETPVFGVTSVQSKSAFINLPIHVKYYSKRNIYISLGSEASFLIWNYGSTYNGDQQIRNVKETDQFKRTNFFVSTSIGYSIKMGESRKNAPVQVDVFLFVELRYKQGINNILQEEFFGDIDSRISAFELVMGFLLGSKT